MRKHHKNARKPLQILLIVVMAHAAMGFTFPGTAQRFWNQGDRAFKRGDYERAVELYGRALEEKPEEWKLRYNMGVAQAKAGQTTAAKETLQQVAREGPPEMRGLAEYNTGTIHLQESENERAAEHYKRALRQNPADTDAKWNLELALRQQEQQEQEQQQQGGDKQEDDNQQGQQPGGQQPDDGDSQKEDDESAPQPEQQQQDDEEQAQQQEPRRMSEEEAKRLLRALSRHEQEQQREQAMQRQEQQAGGARPEKDW